MSQGISSIWGLIFLFTIGLPQGIHAAAPPTFVVYRWDATAHGTQDVGDLAQTSFVDQTAGWLVLDLTRSDAYALVWRFQSSTWVDWVVRGNFRGADSVFSSRGNKGKGSMSLKLIQYLDFDGTRYYEQFNATGPLIFTKKVLAKAYPAGRSVQPRMNGQAYGPSVQFPPNNAVTNAFGTGSGGTGIVPFASSLSGPFEQSAADLATDQMVWITNRGSIRLTYDAALTEIANIGGGYKYKGTTVAVQSIAANGLESFLEGLSLAHGLTLSFDPSADLNALAERFLGGKLHMLPQTLSAPISGTISTAGGTVKSGSASLTLDGSVVLTGNSSSLSTVGTSSLWSVSAGSLVVSNPGTIHLGSLTVSEMLTISTQGTFEALHQSIGGGNGEFSSASGTIMSGGTFVLHDPPGVTEGEPSFLPDQPSE
jgi:hypothetical protein